MAPATKRLHPLVGTWKLLSCYHKLAKGKTFHPFGPKPTGRLVYTALGRMIVILLDSRRPKSVSGQLFEATGPELVRSAKGTVAYSGCWEANGDTVVHRVDVSLFPNWIGTSQVRKFRIKGRRVTFSTRPFTVRGMVQTAHLVWEREA